MVTQLGYIAPLGFTVWLTGLSGAGKSTIAHALREHLAVNGLVNLTILDGDEVRASICKDLGFTREDRRANIRRIGFLGRTLAHRGIPNVVALISPYRKIRQEIREIIPAFIEVYVNCPLEVCEQRDVKGLYAKARRDEIKLFTGIDDLYEPPVHPEVIVHTDRETVQESIQKIISFLLTHNYLIKIYFKQETLQDTGALHRWQGLLRGQAIPKTTR
jgi:adenylylsulfate kinase